MCNGEETELTLSVKKDQTGDLFCSGSKQQTTLYSLDTNWKHWQFSFHLNLFTNKSELTLKDTKYLTVKCWKSQAFIMLVAALGNIPLFFWLFFDCSSSVLSPFPSSEPTDVFNEGSEMKRQAMFSLENTVVTESHFKDLILLHVALREYWNRQWWIRHVVKTITFAIFIPTFTWMS